MQCGCPFGAHSGTPPLLSGVGATTFSSDRDGLATGNALPGGLNISFGHDASGRPSVV